MRFHSAIAAVESACGAGRRRHEKIPVPGEGERDGLSSAGARWAVAGRNACGLELRAGCYESLACFVAFVLLEVLDEAGGQILGLLLPLGGIGVSVARVEDVGVDTFELCGDGEVEVRNLLGRRSVDRMVWRR